MLNYFFGKREENTLKEIADRVEENIDPTFNPETDGLDLNQEEMAFENLSDSELSPDEQMSDDEMKGLEAESTMDIEAVKANVEAAKAKYKAGK